MGLSVAAPEESGVQAQKQTYLQAYRWMLLARLLDEKLASLYRGGKIHGGVFLGKGQEALSVSIGQQLVKGDVFAPLIRDAAGRLAFGETIFDALRTYMGSVLGPMRGRDGNVHRGKPREGYLPMISHLGAMISVVNGFLMAKRFQGQTGFAGAACIGEGATSTGAFHESLNQAAVEKLPLVLIVANNQYAYSTPSSRQFACKSLLDKAAGYGVQSHSVDGTDLAECLKHVGEAISRARSGEGPQLVVARLLRLCGHGEHDDCSYVDSKLRNSPIGRDCLKVAEDYLVEQGWADSELIAGWHKETHQRIDDAAAAVGREPAPDPYNEEWRTLATERLEEIREI